MTLIKCSNCGKDYSDLLSACSHCENYIFKVSNDKMETRTRSVLLINCPGCKNEVYHKAERCPKCAYPIKPKGFFRKFMRRFFFGIFMVIFIWILYYVLIMRPIMKSQKEVMKKLIPKEYYQKGSRENPYNY